jgi:hypothetical protein
MDNQSPRKADISSWLTSLQNADRFEFPHEIEPFEESSGPVNLPVLV